MWLGFSLHVPFIASNLSSKPYFQNTQFLFSAFELCELYIIGKGTLKTDEKFVSSILKTILSVRISLSITLNSWSL